VLKMHFGSRCRRQFFAQGSTHGDEPDDFESSRSAVGDRQDLPGQF